MKTDNTYDIFDYLKWRADVPLSADPFNEVDQLILCELAYSDFDWLAGSNDGITIKDLQAEFFARNSREDLLARDSFIAKAPLLLDGMITGCRFSEMVMTDYIDEVDGDRESQIAAMTFLLSDGTAFIAFRGTDNTLIGWKEDFNLSYLSRTAGQQKAVGYLKNAASTTDRPLRVGGHSKGGNFAVYASAFSGSDVQDRITDIYTNDGPGFRHEVTGSEEYLKVVPKIRSYVPDTSVIGQLLSRKYTDTVVRSCETGIQQHDGFTWCVDRNRFERADLSEAGRFIKMTQSDWLSKMDDDVRESFTNTVFSIFETTGVDTFHEITEQKLKAAERSLSFIRSLPKEKQREMLYVLGELLESGGDIAKTFINEKIERERQWRETGHEEDHPNGHR